MNINEAAQVLARAAAFDNRQPSRAMAEAWSAALDSRLTVDEAIAAIVEHYANSREWITVADVNRIARATRKQRREMFTREHGQVLPEGLGDKPYVEAIWRAALMAAVEEGLTREDAEKYAWQTVEMCPPDPQKRITMSEYRALESRKETHGNP